MDYKEQDLKVKAVKNVNDEDFKYYRLINSEWHEIAAKNFWDCVYMFKLLQMSIETTFFDKIITFKQAGK